MFAIQPLDELFGVFAREEQGAGLAQHLWTGMAVEGVCKTFAGRVPETLAGESDEQVALSFLPAFFAPLLAPAQAAVYV